MTRYGLTVMFEAVFSALNARGVRYLIAGGAAVVLHGYVRLTADLDLVVDLAESETRAAVEALLELGLRPRLPVDPLDLADPDIRRQWIDQRGLVGFSFYDPDQPLLEVDLLIDTPMDFGGLWERADTMSLETVDVRVVSLEDLIVMKRSAGRTKDLLDIEELERIRSITGEES